MGLRLGILGGGQLSRMLLESAYRLGLKPYIFTQTPEDPAAQLCKDSWYGTWDDPVFLRKFLSQIDLAIFENEFVPSSLLAKAAESLKVRFLPSLSVIERLRNKIRQKELLAELNIRAARYEVLIEPDSQLSERELLEKIQVVFAKGLGVLKWAEQGYDGKGTFFLGTDQLAKDAAQFAKAVQFSLQAVQRGITVFAEETVNFKRELAVIGCLSLNKEFKAYPLVISQQENGICKSVIGPAVSLGVSPHLEREAHFAAKSIAEHLAGSGDFAGVFAIEFFETESGELWVNELAPRVHNSGHYSQDASCTSQFENHLRAVLGLPLGSVSTSKGFAMLNLLGSDSLQALSSPPTQKEPVEQRKLLLPKTGSAMHLHWYGKSELRSGRKIGHLNAQTDSPESVHQILADLKECEQQWLNQK